MRLEGIDRASGLRDSLAKVAATAATLEQERQDSEPAEYKLVWDTEPISIYCNNCGDNVR